MEQNLEKYGDEFKNSYGANKLKVSVFSIFNAKIREIKNAWNGIYSDSQKVRNYNGKYINKRFSEHDYGVYLKELKEFSDMLNEIINNRKEFISFIDENKNDSISKEDEAFINNFIKYSEEKGINDKPEFLTTSLIILPL